MLTVGDTFPDFDLAAVVGRTDPRIEQVRRSDFAGRWLVAFFWPMDFTSVCPTEIFGFGRASARFGELGVDIVGGSVDSQHAHLAWRRTHPHLHDVPFPMLADVRRELTGPLGIIDAGTGVALRATFVVDPDARIRHVSVHDLRTGRNVEEVLRTVGALQAGAPTPCGWQPGDDTLAE